MQVDRYLTAAARQQIRDAVREAGGNEVFFVGRLDDAGLVAEVEVHCRGNADAVPALLHVPRAGEAVIHNHPDGPLTPSAADLSLASRYGQDGIAFYIVDNEAAGIYVVVEPQRTHRQRLDADAVAAVLGPDGALPEVLAGYEPRPAQGLMARAVVQAIDGDGVALIEAGTGTGKSLAYLVPLVEHARANRVRVAVSTRSINLQQQLVTKDIPLVRRLIGDVRAVLVKGRGNYLCRRKLADRLQHLDEHDDGERAFLEQIARWAEASADGSLSDLPGVPPTEHWELVRSDADQTLRSRCPHFQDCFFYRARREAAAADLLVVNHHLLLADLQIKEQVGASAGPLPRYEVLAIDEGHHLEEVATSMLATRVTTRGVEQLIGRLWPRSTRRRGMLGRLLDRLPGGDPTAAEVRTLCADRLQPAIARLRTDLPVIAAAICDRLERRLDEAAPERRGRGERGALHYRLPPRLDAVEPALRPLVDHVETLVARLGEVSREVGRLRDRLDELPEAWREQQVQLRFDLRSVHDRLSAAMRNLGAVIEDDEQRCRWIERNRGKDGSVWPRFCTSPIEVGPRIREVLFDPLASVIVTSATLTVDRRFEHLARRVGLVEGTLAAERCTRDRFDSPFDHREQVWFGVPDDLPPPGAADHAAAIEDAVCRVVAAAGGRTFVLFTSYALLRQVHRAAQQRLPELRFLAQGTLERGRLLEEFRAGRRAVLLGTDSFWEGVDVPGEALSCVVLTRLPFRVPTEPVQRARAERIEARGGDPFREYAVPQAVIRFRQGFGRLIRSRRDRGAVVVLDPRVVTRRYGQIFVRSLPPVEVRRMGLEDLAAGIRAFLAG